MSESKQQINTSKIAGCVGELNRRTQGIRVNWATVGIVAAVLLLSIYLSITTTSFLTTTNLLTLSRQVSMYGLMSMGLTYVLISGQIDLSVGAVYSLAGVLTAIMIIYTDNAYLAILIGLSAGMLVGVVNGILSAYLKLPSFIVTLGILQVIFGVNLLLTGGGVTGVHRSEAIGFAFLTAIGRGRIFDLPVQFIIMISIGIIAWLVLSRSAYGLNIYASGGSPSAAHLTGIKVPKVQLIAFICSGTLAALAGILQLGFISSVSPVGGRGIEFDVFAAAVLGGASLFGGRGTIPGALMGAIFLGILRNGLILQGVSDFWQAVIIGLVTILAVGVNRLVLVQSATSRS